MNHRKNPGGTLFVLLTMLMLSIGTQSSGTEKNQHSKDVFPKTLEACFTVLKNAKADQVIRRAAFHRLIYNPMTMRQAIESGLKDIDPGIRRLAVYQLYQVDGKKALPVFYKMADDKSEEVRDMVNIIGISLSNRKETNQLFHFMQQKNHKAASNSKVFRYFRINKPISQSPTYDHQIVLLKSIQLPLDGWAFRTDFKQCGHLEKWFDVKLDDSKWKRISINKTWEEQGYAGYDGIAWYRIKFKMPPKISCLAVELSFGGVDETAWVWLNGQYVGQHDVGPEGWKIPFKLDITSEIGWGKENLLTVRVKDREMAGGIYKPVYVEVIK